MLQTGLPYVIWVTVAPVGRGKGGGRGRVMYYGRASNGCSMCVVSRFKTAGGPRPPRSQHIACGVQLLELYLASFLLTYLALCHGRPCEAE